MVGHVFCSYPTRFTSVRPNGAISIRGVILILVRRSMESRMWVCTIARATDHIPLSLRRGRKCGALGGSLFSTSLVYTLSLLRQIGGGVLGDVWKAEQRGQAMAIYTLAPQLGPCIGPICGAWIAARSSWRWVVSTTSVTP